MYLMSVVYVCISDTYYALCTFLYMQSRDSTVFFLSIKEGYDPIGFIQTPAPVTSLMWSQNVSKHVHVHTHTHTHTLLELHSKLQFCNT